jgi:hypothetical protein
MLFLIRFYSLVRLTNGISMGYPLVAPVPSEAGYARICLLALVAIPWQCLGVIAPVDAGDGCNPSHSRPFHDEHYVPLSAGITMVAILFDLAIAATHFDVTTQGPGIAPLMDVAFHVILMDTVVLCTIDTSTLTG